ncbi:hypothetical protein BOTNAR_0235g00050 [Botryotinia narcissicola]|uniref:Uncharacterized protein n=1 Tax=Botryotinia narcissicola TaxID=278944 RepID=A0A4Z1IGZ7_9HELO|nr:hypothetical protein BOTNAR_0235g00050 [Botryotinia narcissicola]
MKGKSIVRLDPQVTTPLAMIYQFAHIRCLFPGHSPSIQRQSYHRCFQTRKCGGWIRCQPPTRVDTGPEKSGICNNAIQGYGIPMFEEEAEQNQDDESHYTTIGV